MKLPSAKPLLLVCLLSGCASITPTAANNYEPADLQAAISIAQANGDTARLGCYQAILKQLQTIAQAKGPLSLAEAVRVSKGAVLLACTGL